MTYECGGMRQDVHSKKILTPEEAAAREQASEKRVVLTPEEAAKREAELLLQSKPGRNDDAIADIDYLESQAFADKFKGKYANEDVEQAVISACRQIVKNRNGTDYEEAFFIDARTGKTISYIKGKVHNGIEMSDELKKRLTNAPEESIFMVHNHPNSSPLSRTDFVSSSGYRCFSETIAVGHNGDVYCFRGRFGTQGELLGYFIEREKSYPYYEAIRDYRVAYSKYSSRGESDFTARDMAWKDVSEMRGFVYEKR